jgi:hypothetical protein
MDKVTQLSALNQRCWAVEGGVHPTRSPQYLSLGKFSADPAQNIGEETRVSAPDPNHFDRDIQIGTVPGETERATLGIGIRSTAQASILQKWKNDRCRVDIYALTGKCGNPQDFTEGGEKWIYFPDGKISSHSFENFGAFGRDENNPTNEMVDMTSEEYYELLMMDMDQIAAAESVRQLYTVDFYPGEDCDDCPDPCGRVVITMQGASATPGTQPIALWSVDGGETWTSKTIDTLFSNEDISDADFIGGDFVLISNTAHEIHYIDAPDLFDAGGTWQQNGNGFVVGKNPKKMVSVDPRHTWIVGDGGYVYFAKDHRTTIDVQDAGVATSQNLNAVSASSTKNVLAVGNLNAVIFTNNGGLSWQSVTGPAVGINLGACWMWDEQTWFAGEGAGGTGKLWLTVNSGRTWTQVALPANYLRIDKITFISEAEGYLLARDGSKEYALRTITAGNEWVVLPQGKRGVALGNSYLNDIAACSKYQNLAIAVGVATNGTSGIAFKYAA